MNRKVFGLVTVLILAFAQLVEAQQAKKVPAIGFLALAPLSTLSARLEAFRQGLHDLGYVQGKNIVVEYRYADEKRDRLPELAAELVRLKVEVIVTGGGTATQIAKEATSTIPIVMAADNDPIGSGFIASLARPGGNITGLCTLSPEISGKRLELLKELVPRLSRLGCFWGFDQPRKHASTERYGTCCSSTQGTASISRHIRSKRY